MLKHRSKLVILLALTAVAISGCDDHARKKKEINAKWQHDKARTNVPVARSLLQEGKIDQAQQTLVKILQDAPDLPEAHLLMGQIYFTRDRMTAAEESFNKAAKLARNYDRALYWLGETARHQGQLPQAIQHYRRAMEIKPSSPTYIFALSNAYAESSDYDMALDLIDRKIDTFPNTTSLVLAKADILVRCDRKDQVSNAYESGLLLNSDSTELIEGLGYCHLIDKNWIGAIEMFERLVETASDNDKKDEYLKVLGTCSMNVGQYGRALGYLDKINAGYKDDPQYWFESGQAALGAGQAKRAVFCAKRVMFLRPGLPEGVILLGSAMYMDGDYASSLKAFGMATSNEQTAKFAWMMTGKCYQKMGEDEKARLAFQKAANFGTDTELLSLVGNTDK